jgi:formylglycine-generating enzyme required for sulfatase activity
MHRPEGLDGSATLFQRNLRDVMRKGLIQEQARVLRGGSWNNNRNNARCSYRNRNEPDNFNNNIGFRLVCSTSFVFMPEMRRGEKLRRRGFDDG